MIKQDAFEKQYAATWQRFAEWIEILQSDRRRLRRDDTLSIELASEFPAVYRELCHHLAIARTRQYSSNLQRRLNELVLQGHQHLYQSRTTMLGSIGRFLAVDFPRSLRAQWRYLLASTLCFYLPGLAIMVALLLKPDLIYTLMSPAEVAMMEQMYDPTNDVLGRERQSETDAYMFGYYIYNNITIGFQTFAGGLSLTTT